LLWRLLIGGCLTAAAAAAAVAAAAAAAAAAVQAGWLTWRVRWGRYRPAGPWGTSARGQQRGQHVWGSGALGLCSRVLMSRWLTGAAAVEAH